MHAVRHWKLQEVETPEGTRSPVVLHSRDGEGRVVLIRIDAGQELGEHQVKEAALLLAPWPGEGHYRGERPAAVSAS